MDDLVSSGATNYVKHESMVFWLINKDYKWDPRLISLGENILYRYQFEVLVVLSFLIPLHSFNFFFKSECCLILCHYQLNYIYNVSGKLFVVYNYKYLEITSRHQISCRGLNHYLFFMILKSWCSQICHWVSLTISKSLYQFCIMVELVHPLFVSIFQF